MNSDGHVKMLPDGAGRLNGGRCRPALSAWHGRAVPAIPPDMNLLTLEVQLDHGRVTPTGVGAAARHGQRPVDHPAGARPGERSASPRSAPATRDLPRRSGKTSDRRRLARGFLLKLLLDSCAMGGVISV